MRIVINYLAVLLAVVALLSLTLPIAIFGTLLSKPDASTPGLLFALPALLFSVIAGLIVFRHYRRRNLASAKSVVAASCFLLWLVLNTVSMNESHVGDDLHPGLMLLHLLAPILIAVLLNRLLQKSVDRAYLATPPVTA